MLVTIFAVRVLPLTFDRVPHPTMDILQNRLLLAVKMATFLTLLPCQIEHTKGLVHSDLPVVDKLHEGKSLCFNQVS